MVGSVLATRRQPRLRFAAISTAFLALAAPLHAAAACRVEPVPSGTTIDVTNGIAGLPGRQIQRIEPGQVLHFSTRFQNRMGSRIVMDFATRDVEGTSDASAQPLELTEEGPFGASRWITTSCSKVALEHGETAVVDVTATAPLGQDPGSYYAAVVGSVSDTGGAARSSASIASAIGVQIFFDVPGPRVLAGRIVNVRSPRLLVHSRAHHAEVIGAAYRNEGSITDAVSGQVVITSFTDRRVASLNMDQAIVLRGGSRQFVGRWKDLPWFGRFEPVIEMTRSDGSVAKRKLEPIWVIPSWPYWLLLIGAIALPFIWRVWDRRRIDRILSEHHDADWFDDESGGLDEHEQG